MQETMFWKSTFMRFKIPIRVKALKNRNANKSTNLGAWRKPTQPVSSPHVMGWIWKGGSVRKKSRDSRSQHLLNPARPKGQTVKVDLSTPLCNMELLWPFRLRGAGLMEIDLSLLTHQLPKTKDMMAKDDSFGATSGARSLCRPGFPSSQLAITLTLASWSPLPQNGSFPEQ